MRKKIERARMEDKALKLVEKWVKKCAMGNFMAELLLENGLVDFLSNSSTTIITIRHDGEIKFPKESFGPTKGKIKSVSSRKLKRILTALERGEVIWEKESHSAISEREIRATLPIDGSFC